MDWAWLNYSCFLFQTSTFNVLTWISKKVNIVFIILMTKSKTDMSSTNYSLALVFAVFIPPDIFFRGTVILISVQEKYWFMHNCLTFSCGGGIYALRSQCDVYGRGTLVLLVFMDVIYIKHYHQLLISCSHFNKINNGSVLPF